MDDKALNPVFHPVLVMLPLAPVLILPWVLISGVDWWSYLAMNSCSY